MGSHPSSERGTFRVPWLGMLCMNPLLAFADAPCGATLGAIPTGMITGSMRGLRAKQLAESASHVPATVRQPSTLPGKSPRQTGRQREHATKVTDQTCALRHVQSHRSAHLVFRQA
jgi:hypothetical protein